MLSIWGSLFRPPCILYHSLLLRRSNVMLHNHVQWCRELSSRVNCWLHWTPDPIPIALRRKQFSRREKLRRKDRESFIAGFWRWAGELRLAGGYWTRRLITGRPPRCVRWLPACLYSFQASSTFISCVLFAMPCSGPTVRSTAANIRRRMSIDCHSEPGSLLKPLSTHRSARRGTRSPKIREKYFSGNYYVEFGHFSSKNRVKCGNFVNFSEKCHKNSGILLIFRARIM